MTAQAANENEPAHEPREQEQHTSEEAMKAELEGARAEDRYGMDSLDPSGKDESAYGDSDPDPDAGKRRSDRDEVDQRANATAGGQSGQPTPR